MHDRNQFSRAIELFGCSLWFWVQEGLPELEVACSLAGGWVGLLPPNSSTTLMAWWMELAERTRKRHLEKWTNLSLHTGGGQADKGGLPRFLCQTPSLSAAFSLAHLTSAVASSFCSSGCNKVTPAMQIRPDFICIKCHMKRQAVVLILSVLTTVSGSYWAQRRGRRM